MRVTGSHVTVTKFENELQPQPSGLDFRDPRKFAANQNSLGKKEITPFFGPFLTGLCSCEKAELDGWVTFKARDTRLFVIITKHIQVPASIIHNTMRCIFGQHGHDFIPAQLTLEHSQTVEAPTHYLLPVTEQVALSHPLACGFGNHRQEDFRNRKCSSLT